METSSPDRRLRSPRRYAWNADALVNAKPTRLGSCRFSISARNAPLACLLPFPLAGLCCFSFFAPNRVESRRIASYADRVALEWTTETLRSLVAAQRLKSTVAPMLGARAWSLTCSLSTLNVIYYSRHRAEESSEESNEEARKRHIGRSTELDYI